MSAQVPYMSQDAQKLCQRFRLLAALYGWSTGLLLGSGAWPGWIPGAKKHSTTLFDL